VNGAAASVADPGAFHLARPVAVRWSVRAAPSVDAGARCGPAVRSACSAIRSCRTLMVDPSAGALVVVGEEPWA